MEHPPFVLSPVSRLNIQRLIQRFIWLHRYDTLHVIPYVLDYTILILQIVIVLLNAQYIKFYFSPYAKTQSAEDFASSQIGNIKEMLWQITRIEHGYWDNYNSWFIKEQNTGELQPVIEFEIQPEASMVAKIASFVKLLEYDNTEIFKTMFNEKIVHQHELWGIYDESSYIYMTRVGDDYFSDMDSWSRYLTQGTTFDESSSIHAVGGGVLYVMIDGVPRTFCNETVCGAYFLLESICNIAVCAPDYIVGMGRDSSGL